MGHNVVPASRQHVRGHRVGPRRKRLSNSSPNNTCEQPAVQRWAAGADSAVAAVAAGAAGVAAGAAVGGKCTLCQSQRLRCLLVDAVHGVVAAVTAPHVAHRDHDAHRAGVVAWGEGLGALLDADSHGGKGVVARELQNTDRGS